MMLILAVFSVLCMASLLLILLAERSKTQKRIRDNACTSCSDKNTRVNKNV
jgi:hypothetical protein